MLFACISVQGWVTDSDENDFFDGSCNILVFSAHIAKIVNRYVMASGAVMIKDG